MFDSAEYAALKPMFDRAVDHFGVNSSDAQEVMEAIVRYLLEEFAPQTVEIRNIDPFILRYVERACAAPSEDHFVDPLVRKAIDHWALWLPRKRSLLQAEEMFERAAALAALWARHRTTRLIEHGFPPETAEEITLKQHNLLEPEADRDLEPWEDELEAELADREGRYQEMMAAGAQAVREYDLREARREWAILKSMPYEERIAELRTMPQDDRFLIADIMTPEERREYQRPLNGLE